MRIAIIGAGSVGGALGRGWAAAGHAIRFGLRDPAAGKYAPLASTGTLLSPVAAAEGAEAILLATPWPQAEAAIAGLGDLAGRLLIDATNPLAVGPAGLGLAIGHTESGGERVAGWAPGARVVKAFNTTGANIMDSARRGFALPPVMFAAGDDAAAKAAVLGLIRDLGFEAVDAGPLANARLLEAHAMLWIDLALKRGLGREQAFALMRREGG